MTLVPDTRHKTSGCILKASIRQILKSGQIAKNIISGPMDILLTVLKDFYMTNDFFSSEIT